MLHVAANPLVLVNIWDAASAMAVDAQGFRAIATSSHSVAEAAGYQDGQKMPLEELLHATRLIVRSTDKPVTVDFEAGFSDDPQTVGINVQQLIEAGAVGINLEDGLIGGKRRLVDPSIHAAKIAACRKAAEVSGVPLFINARIDTFLLSKNNDRDLVKETLVRASAYREAGADGIFLPGLSNPEWIREVVGECWLPVNIMLNRKTTSIAALASVGVARVSLAVWPFEFAYEAFKGALKEFDESRDLGAFLTPE